ncbi:MAG: YbhB/YbcL family Raf kinase inhibitor-like protein [bacterium]
MNKTISVIALLLACACSGNNGENSAATGTMKLASADFKNNKIMDSRFTCDGKNVPPELSWQGAPEGTKSFVLMVKDPDAPGGNFDHWLIADIPASVSGIPRGGPVPAGSRELDNGFRRTGYGGPCPPSGTHRYVFTLYALDTGRLEGVTAGNIVEMAEKNAMAKATITGRYKR